MMDGSGSLEEQLAAVGLKAHEVASKSSTLKQIEELGANIYGIVSDNFCGPKDKNDQQVLHTSDPDQHFLHKFGPDTKWF